MPLLQTVSKNREISIRVAENAGRAVIISSQSEMSILSDSSILYNMNFKYDVTNYVCSKKNVSHLHIL